MAYILLLEVKSWKTSFLTYTDMFALETGTQQLSYTNGIMLKHAVPAIRTYVFLNASVYL